MFIRKKKLRETHGKYTALIAMISLSHPQHTPEIQFFYISGTIERRGDDPLLELLDKLGGWPVLEPNWNASQFDWVQLSAKLRVYYNDILILHWVGQDFMVSSNYIIQVR